MSRHLKRDIGVSMLTSARSSMRQMRADACASGAQRDASDAPIGQRLAPYYPYPSDTARLAVALRIGRASRYPSHAPSR